MTLKRPESDPPLVVPFSEASPRNAFTSQQVADNIPTLPDPPPPTPPPGEGQEYPPDPPPPPGGWPGVE